MCTQFHHLKEKAINKKIYFTRAFYPVSKELFLLLSIFIQQWKLLLAIDLSPAFVHNSCVASSSSPVVFISLFSGLALIYVCVLWLLSSLVAGFSAKVFHIYSFKVLKNSVRTSERSKLPTSIVHKAHLCIESFRHLLSVQGNTLSIWCLCLENVELRHRLVFSQYLGASVLLLRRCLCHWACSRVLCVTHCIQRFLPELPQVTQLHSLLDQVQSTTEQNI